MSPLLTSEDTRKEARTVASRRQPAADGSNYGILVTMAMSPEVVRAELERLLASETFVNSGRLSRLLRFLVERTLEGRQDEIKEFVVGTEVFDRGPDYDPRLDSIVRVEARRLRSKLDEHYANDEGGRPVAIRLRRGSYVPLFIAAEAGVSPERSGVPAGSGLPDTVVSSRRSRAAAAAAVFVLLAAGAVWLFGPSAAAPARPRVAVLPFTVEGKAPALAEAAETLGGDVTSAFVRLNRFEVVPRRSAAAFAREPHVIAEVARRLDADWLVEATLRSRGSHIVAEVRLVDVARHRKVWVEIFVGEPSDTRPLARTIVESLGREIDRWGQVLN